MRDRARQLRQQSTPTEQRLWRCLRAHRLQGFGFRRQQVIGPYITDFCCLEKKLVIEIDGSVHDHPEQVQYDEVRQRYLEAVGFKVVRFTASEVEENLEGVLAVIIQSLPEGSPPP